MNLKRLVLWCVVMVPTLVVATHAQTSKGIIVGVVRDQSGAVIANATVTVRSEETTESRRTTANDRGEFRIDAINPGHYAVHVEAPSFQSVDIRNLTVPPSVVTSYNAILNTGSVAETLTVNATTNGINTENGELTTTVNSTELSAVPIFSLNPFELLQNIPGAQVVDSNLGLNGIGGNFVQIEVNGARPRSNNYMMDGQDINDIGIGGQAFNVEIPDAFQSITALTNSASAEYGRSGGAVINLVTKSGTNQLHGDLWEVYTGSGLDSLDGVTRQSKSAAKKARYDEHQFGFTAGGPVWRDKLFGFGGLQVTRFYGNSQPGAVVLPDATGYAQLTAIGGPQVALLQAYLGNGSYLQTFNKGGAAGSFKISPRPGCTNGCSVSTAQFERPPVSQQEPDTQWLFRLDFIPSTRDTFSYRYLHDRANFNPDLGLNTSGLPGFDGEVGGPAEVAQGTWTHIFSARLLNEFRASETRTDFLFAPTPEAQANPLFRAPEIEFSGSGFANQNTPLGMSFNIPQGNRIDLYQFQDTVSWTHGAHTLRIGADMGRQIDLELVAQNSIGLLQFAGGGGGASVLDNFLDNYLGPSGQATKTFGPTRIDPHSWKSAAFLQDDFKLTPDLTINLGLRYDYLTWPENSMKYPAIDINNPYAPIDTVTKVKGDFNNFGPRFGFAWNPHIGFFADGKTAFHGGIGVFYDTDFTNIATNDAQASPNAPTGTLQSTTGRGLPNATSLVGTISPTLSPTSTVQSIASNLRNPLTYHWNFGAERQLPAQLKLAVNYVGNHSEKLFANQQLNYFDFNTGKRLNPSRGVINIRSNRAASEYNSLQTELSKQMSHGTFVRVAYTYGKDLDDASDVFSTFAAPTSYSADLSPGGLGRDWGPSVWDHRHYLAITYVWSPGGLHSNNNGADALLSAFTRHFTISGTTQLQSGYHSTFNMFGLDTNGDGSSANDRPLIGATSKPLDTAGFDGIYFGAPYKHGVYYDAVTALPVTAGDVHWLVPYGPQYLPYEVGRNSYENPGAQYWNIAAEKDLPTSWLHFDRGSLVIRVEAQNFINHDNVGPLDINLLDIGTPAYLNRQNAIEPNLRHLLAWAKFRF